MRTLFNGTNSEQNQNKTRLSDQIFQRESMVVSIVKESSDVARNTALDIKIKYISIHSLS